MVLFRDESLGAGRLALDESVANDAVQEQSQTRKKKGRRKKEADAQPLSPDEAGQLPRGKCAPTPCGRGIEMFGLSDIVRKDDVFSAHSGIHACHHILEEPVAHVYGKRICNSIAAFQSGKF